MAYVVSSAPSVARPVSVAARILDWLSVSRQRKTLAHLTDDALADIGLSRAEAQAEAARPFWDAPNHWTR